MQTKKTNQNASIFLDFKTYELTIFRNINDKLDHDSRVPGLLVSIRGSDAVAFGGEALDGLDEVPDELECLRPLGAASVNIHKCQIARGWGKDNSLHSNQKSGGKWEMSLIAGLSCPAPAGVVELSDWL